MQIVFQKRYDENISANDRFRELRDQTRMAEMGAKQPLPEVLSFVPKVTRKVAF